ncbi:hypothetical protein Q3G72_033592 [Acer saccharum]|nr:hypothetical protein Q3G72_033592 [Acer saccharum]
MFTKRLFLNIALALTATAPAAARADSTGMIGAQKNLCLDVPGGSSANGTPVQIWQCSAGNVNQQWTLSGSQFKAANGKCLDIENGGPNGAKVQLWDCSNGRNQFFQFNGQAIENSKLGLCLDVTDGAFQNGTRVQAWACNGGRGNQVWSFASSQQARSVPQTGGGSNTDATTFYGYTAINTIDDFVAKNSGCAWIKDAVVAAANDQGLNATFLATACIVESSCLQQINNPWGPFQFSDDGAWNEYGGAQKNRQNIWDAAYGAARYFKALLQQENGNLDNALRAYNGPLSQGGNPNYQKSYKIWMSGGNAWEQGL